MADSVVKPLLHVPPLQPPALQPSVAVSISLPVFIWYVAVTEPPPPVAAVPPDASAMVMV